MGEYIARNNTFVENFTNIVPAGSLNNLFTPIEQGNFF